MSFAATVTIAQIAEVLKEHDTDRMECLDHGALCCFNHDPMMHDIKGSRYDHQARAVMGLLIAADATEGMK